MTAAAHSPGPWTLRPRDDCPGFRLEDADGQLIDYLSESRYVDGREDPEQLANLNAMAAGPVLLAALEAEIAKARMAYERTPAAEAHFKRNHAASLAAIAAAKGVE